MEPQVTGLAAGLVQAGNVLGLGPDLNLVAAGLELELEHFAEPEWRDGLLGLHLHELSRLLRLQGHLQRESEDHIF